MNSIGKFNEAKYRAECDMRTLAEAKEIEANKARHAAAKKAAMEKIKEMQSVVAKKPTVKTPARKK